MKRLLLLPAAFVLSISLSAQLNIQSSAIKEYNGRLAISINNQPFYPLIYALTDVPGGRWSWEELPRYNCKNFYDHGFRLFQLDIFFDHIWKEDGSINLDTLQMQMGGLLKVCPDAAIMLRFHVSPPKWWQYKYPEENTLYADTIATPDVRNGFHRLIQDDEKTPERTSLASAKWKLQAGQKLKEVLLQLKNLPEAKSLFGIQVAGGIYGEWHYWGFLNNEPDVSKPMQDYFRNWLKEKYKTEKQLQKAWNDSKVNFETAYLPSLEQKRNTTAGIFRDPVKEKSVIDYYQAQHECVADDILFFCKIVKDNWPTSIITGAFYGYYYAVFGREAAGGHLALQRVLNSPNIDFLCAPAAYYPASSQTGDAYRSRGLINSAIAHKKLILDEMDQQSPLTPAADTGFKKSLEKSIANVKRNMMFSFTHGTGFWFYDFGPSGFNGGPRLLDHGSQGWWDEPTLMNEIGKLKRSFDSLMLAPLKSGADVLLVHDDRSLYYTGSSKDESYMAHWANNWIPPSIFKSGAIHDVVHVDDLDKIDLSQYKAIVFINTWLLNNDQKLVIKNKLKTQNKHLIWIYAPGYDNEKELNTKFIEELTGVKIKSINSDSAATVVVDSSISETRTFSVWSKKINPLFAVSDTGTVVFGRLEGSGEPMLVKKEQKNFTSWYFALPPTDVKLWRYILQSAGAHIYETAGDVLYASHQLLSIHSLNGGDREINLKNEKKVLLNLPTNSTTVIDINTGNIMLQ